MPPLPTLQQLRYFAALAESLNFTRAAQACRVSQSTLSAAVQELESVLGARLFTRSRRAVALTPQGRALLGRARELLSGAEDLVELVQLADQPMRGQLRLGLIPTIAPFQLPRLLPYLRKRFPDLGISVREDLTASLVERLKDRRLDMALIALPYDTKGLLVKPLFEEELLLVGRRGDADLKARRLGPRQAARLLLLEEGHCLREHSLRACGRREAAGREGLEASSLLTLVRMAEDGQGLALLPRMAVDAGLLDHARLEARRLERPPTRGIALVTRASTPHTEAFDKIAEAVIAAQAPSQR